MAQDIIIRLSEVGGSRFFTFPANPETISGTLAAKYQSFDIISKGTVKVPKGTDVTEIKWSGEFSAVQSGMKALCLHNTICRRICVLKL